MNEPKQININNQSDGLLERFNIIRHLNSTSYALKYTTHYLENELIFWIGMRSSGNYTNIESILKKYFYFRRCIQPSMFSDADPFKILWVSPDQIKFQERNFVPMQPGRVIGGSWDYIPFSEGALYQSAKQRFMEGIDWRDTVIYQQEVNKDGSVEADRLFKKLLEMEELYNTIKEGGYKSQRELLVEQPSETSVRNNDAITPELNEIGVSIGPDGQLIWVHRGKHRLAIARLLSVDEVPIQIQTRHENWQRIRHAIRKEKFEPTKEMAHHPDLADVL